MADKKIIRHSLDDGFTSYSSNGTEYFQSNIGHTGYSGSRGTKVVNHVHDSGFDVISNDGSVESFYADGIGHGYSGTKGSRIDTDTVSKEIRSSSPTLNAGSELSGLISWVFGATMVLASIISLASTKYSLLSIGLIVFTVVMRIFLNKRRNTTFFTLWIHPFTLFGWRLMANSMWIGHEGKFSTPFGVFFITLGIFASFFIDCDFGFYFYAGITLFIMILAKAWGEMVPYYLVIAMLLIAVIATPIRLAKRKKK